VSDVRPAQAGRERPVEPDPAAAQVVPVLGFRFYAGSIDDAARTVIVRALSGEGGYACLTGVHGVTTARRDREHCRALRAAWMNFPDGMPVAWRQRFGGARHAERVGGPDLMPRVAELGQPYGLRHFLMGSTDGVLDRLSRSLAGRYPNLRLVGTYSPPFRPLDEREQAEMAQAIRAARPHIVWIGLGAPKQDLWMYRHSESLSPALCMGVGAAFDFVSGSKRRAPVWMRRSGLEWTFRLAQEPRRLAPRYIQSNSRFVADNVIDLSRKLRGADVTMGEEDVLR
jgi:N-acetylglucosaminyldiphosphoundecaprenol N-acetyl-beta-D-mannosaminyltransferase